MFPSLPVSVPCIGLVLKRGGGQGGCTVEDSFSSPVQVAIDHIRVTHPYRHDGEDVPSARQAGVGRDIMDRGQSTFLSPLCFVNPQYKILILYM